MDMQQRVRGCFENRGHAVLVLYHYTYSHCCPFVITGNFASEPCQMTSIEIPKNEETVQGERGS